MRVSCPVAAAAQTAPSSDALVTREKTYSYAQLDAEVRSAVAWLEQQGVTRGDRVGVVAWNCVETVVLFHAVGRLGAALVPFNARLSAAELEPLMASARCKLLFVDAQGRRSAAPAGEGKAAATDSEPHSARNSVAALEASPMPAWGSSVGSDVFLGEDSDVAAVLFTSGTTGTPKPVALTRANFEASAAASAKNLGSSPAQRWLLCLPLFHVGGLALISRCAFYGATVVLEPGFDVARTSALIDAGEVTHASFVATALRRLLSERAGRSVPSTLEAVLIGGGPLPVELWRAARGLNFPVLQTYGLTEACSQVATERLADADGETAGPPLTGIEVRVVSDNGSDCTREEVGEIWVRGPTVATAGEWLHTKDLGSLDERGRLTVHARRTDLIISGGENVYPAEVERVLEGHSQVREAAVCGRVDSEWGQIPVAAVVVDAGLTEADLRHWVSTRLARYKQPRLYRFVDALPRNANGKIDRLALTADAQR